MFAASKSGSAADPTDPQFNYVTMLLHGDGTNGAQNNTFLDSSTNNFTITRNGNTTQGTFTPYGSNWSNYFDGTTDYLNTPSNAAFGMGTGDFTVETWIYFTAAQAEKHITDSNASSGLFLKTNATNVGIGRAMIGEDTMFNYSFSQNVWYHIAFARSGSTVYGFINGVQIGSATNTNSYATGACYVGAASDGSRSVNGYISNLRIVKGTAVYTSAFTPSTTPLTAITNTSLLTCQSNRFIDNSTNNFTITKSGDVSVQRFSPFSPTAAYSTSVIGGSGYFDGSGDYLTELTATTALNLSSGDWSISFWVYKTATANGSIVNLYNSAGNTSGLSIWIGSSGVKVDNGISGGVQAGTVVVNAWSYIEVIRSSGTTTIYVNGVSAGTTTQTPNASQYGSFGSAADGTLPHQGYVTDLRIVKGTALSSSVPTAPLTAITNTSLLLNFTNAGILDNAMMNDLETVGNAQISTSVKKYGTGSMYFDGTDDRLNMPSSPNLAFGTGDFTLEMWAYFTSTANFPTLTDSRANTSSTAGFNLGLSSAKVQLYTTSQLLIGSSTLSANTWYHIAVTRASGTLKIWLNGTQDATVANSTNWSDQTFIVGATPTPTNYMTGYIDDLRITKYARYTATFTPSTTAFPDKG